MSGAVRHDGGAKLYVILAESIVFEQLPDGAENGLFCHWYANDAKDAGSADHRQSDAFQVPATGKVVQVDWCVFLVMDTAADTELRLTVADADGNHLAVYFGDAKSLAPQEEFDISEVVLKNVNGELARVTVHAAAQLRWTRQNESAHMPGTLQFHEAGKDAQCEHIWRWLFPDRDPPGMEDQGKSFSMTCISEEPDEDGDDSLLQDESQAPGAAEAAAAVAEEEQRRKVDEEARRRAKEEKEELRKKDEEEEELRKKEEEEEEAARRKQLAQFEAERKREMEKREKDKEEVARRKRLAEEEAERKREIEKLAAELAAERAAEHERETEAKRHAEAARREAEEQVRLQAERKAIVVEEARSEKQSIEVSNIDTSERSKPRQERSSSGTRRKKSISGSRRHLGAQKDEATLSAEDATEVRSARTPCEDRAVPSSSRRKPSSQHAKAKEAQTVVTQPNPPKRSQVVQGMHPSPGFTKSAPTAPWDEDERLLPTDGSEVQDLCDSEPDLLFSGDERCDTHGIGRPQPKVTRSINLGKVSASGRSAPIHEVGSHAAPNQDDACLELEMSASPAGNVWTTIRQQASRSMTRRHSAVALDGASRGLANRHGTASRSVASSASRVAKSRGAVSTPGAHEGHADAQLSGMKACSARELHNPTLGQASCSEPSMRAGGSPCASMPGRRLYRVLTRSLGVRVGPNVRSARTGMVLRCGDIFEASVVAPGIDGRIYLKLSGARGWVFDDSEVDPSDPSVELVPEHVLLARRGMPSRASAAMRGRYEALDDHYSGAEWSTVAPQTIHAESFSGHDVGPFTLDLAGVSRGGLPWTNADVNGDYSGMSARHLGVEDAMELDSLRPGVSTGRFVHQACGAERGWPAPERSARSVPRPTRDIDWSGSMQSARSITTETVSDAQLEMQHILAGHDPISRERTTPLHSARVDSARWVSPMPRADAQSSQLGSAWLPSGMPLHAASRSPSQPQALPRDIAAPAARSDAALRHFLTGCSPRDQPQLSDAMRDIMGGRGRLGCGAVQPLMVLA